MPWPILTFKEALDTELKAVNDFLKRKKLPTIKSLEFVDDETTSFIVVNGGEYYIDTRSEQVMMKNLRGSYPVTVMFLCASYTEEGVDPDFDHSGQVPIFESSNFGSLAHFLLQVELEKINREWHSRAYTV